MGRRIRPNDTDEELFESWRGSGSREALEALIDRLTPFVLNVARSASPRAAEDVAQDALLAMIRRTDTFRSGGRIRAWVARLVLSTAASRSRGEARRRRREAYRTEHRSEPVPSTELAENEMRRELSAALRGLSAEQRVPIVLHYQEGLTLREVAAAQGVSHTAVARRLQTALGTLRRRLAEGGFAGLALVAVEGHLASLPGEKVPEHFVASMRSLLRNAPRVSIGAGAASGGGIAMKVIAGIVLAAAVAAGAAVVSSGGGGNPLPAAAAPSGHKDFEYTTLGKTFRIEWACFTGVVEHLDGPGREGMGRQMGGSSTQGCLRGMQSDAGGNLYMCDMTSGMIRVLRKRDRTLLTISGNGHVTAGRVPEKEGPAYSLNLDQNVYIAAQGEPLEGKGSLYLATQGRVLRLWRNEKKGGLWWYELIAGGGPTAIRGPGTYPALGVSLRGARVVVSPDGRVGVIRATGGGKESRNLLFWLKDGKLVPAYDEKAIGTKFSCYGIDGAGNFAGAGADGVMTVAPDGSAVKHKIKVPFGLSWGVYPDRRREQWFVKGMDHYTLTRVTPDGKTATLMLDGSWHEHKAGMGGRGYNLRGALPWMWCLPLQDGRMVGWNSHGCQPLFVGTWLEGGE